jgi:hypothetical protein
MSPSVAFFILNTAKPLFVIIVILQLYQQYQDCNLPASIKHSDGSKDPAPLYGSQKIGCAMCHNTDAPKKSMSTIFGPIILCCHFWFCFSTVCSLPAYKNELKKNLVLHNNGPFDKSPSLGMSGKNWTAVLGLRLKLEPQKKPNYYWFQQ